MIAPQLDPRDARIAELEAEIRRLKSKRRVALRAVDNTGDTPREVSMATFLRAAGLSSFSMLPALKASLERKLRTDPAAFALAVAEARAWTERGRELHRRHWLAGIIPWSENRGAAYDRPGSTAKPEPADPRQLRLTA